MPKVCICCVIYNHAPFLRQCLDGFIAQQTNFDFVVLAHDDVSTDNSAAIIQEYATKYPNVIIPIIEEENQYSKSGSYDIINRLDEESQKLGADYIAYCDGDDCWTDPLKLQKQIDILDADFSLIGIATDASIIDMQGNVLCTKRGSVVPGNIEGKYSIHDFFKEPTHKYPTASVVRRVGDVSEITKKYNHTKNKFLGDWTMWIVLLTYGDFYYLDQPTVAYRVNEGSVTHAENKVERAYVGVEVCKRISEILPSPECDYIARRLLNKKRELPISLAHAYLDGKQYAKAMWYAVVSVFSCPGAVVRTMKRVIDRKSGKLNKYI